MEDIQVAERKFTGKKKLLIIGAIVLAVLVLIAVVTLVLFKTGVIKSPFSKNRQNNMQFNGMTLSDDMITASGVVSVGVTEENFEVENFTSDLVIEEVCVTSGEEITEGTQILKLTEDSVAEVREELEQTLRSADLAYRAGAIEYEQNKISAEYNYKSTLLAGEQAEEIYNETLSGLEESVTQAEEKLEDAQEQIEEYQSYVNDDSYKSYFKVDEYQALYDENLKLLTDKMEEWGVSWPQVTGGQNPMEPYSYASILSGLYSVLEQNAKDLEQAQSEYDDAVLNAAFELQTLELQLPSLQQAVLEAKENYATQTGQAKLTYETALTNAESAERDYETALELAESTYSSLKDEYEDAKENLELFESSVGDGSFYSSGSGSVLRVMARAGQNLSPDSVVFMYSNTEEMAVTVSVDQSDISKLAVGDEAYVMSSSAQGCTGTVTSINPITNSDSRTNVTYNVTVTLSGDTSAFTVNQSVTVIFGVSAEEIEKMMQQSEEQPGDNSQENMPGDTPENGQDGRPDGEQGMEGAPGADGNGMPEGENMPDKGDASDKGDAPMGEPGAGAENMPDREGRQDDKNQ
jgi:hypothetical protein